MNAINQFDKECGPIEWTLSALDENSNAISDITFNEPSVQISVPSSLDWVTATDFDPKRFVTLQIKYEFTSAITDSITFTVHELSCDLVAQGLSSPVFFGAIPMNTVIHEPNFGDLELIWPTNSPSACE